MIPKGQVKAKAVFYVKTDVEGRRHRERTGLGTPVVFADNYRKGSSPFSDIKNIVSFYKLNLYLI